MSKQKTIVEQFYKVFINITVILQWIPQHRSIAGNEAADGTRTRTRTRKRRNRRSRRRRRRRRKRTRRRRMRTRRSRRRKADLEHREPRSVWSHGLFHRLTAHRMMVTDEPEI